MPDNLRRCYFALLGAFLAFGFGSVSLGALRLVADFINPPNADTASDRVVIPTVISALLSCQEMASAQDLK